MADAPKGGMAVIHCQAENLSAHIGKQDGISIAAVNSPKQCTISGAKDDIRDFVERLEHQGIDGTILDIGCAAHSDFMKEPAEKFAAKFSNFQGGKGSIAFQSTNELGFNDNLRIEYLKRQLVRPVQFLKAIEKLEQEGVTHFLELSATSGLSHCISQAQGEAKVLSSMVRGQDNLDHTLSTWEALYDAGYPMKLQKIWDDGLIELGCPLPFNRSSFWLDIKPTESPVHKNEASSLNPQDLIYSQDHLIEGRASAPFGVLLDVLSEKYLSYDEASLLHVSFLQPLFTDENQKVMVHAQDQGFGLKGLSTGEDILNFGIGTTPANIYGSLDLTRIRNRLVQGESLKVFISDETKAGFS